MILIVGLLFLGIVLGFLLGLRLGVVAGDATGYERGLIDGQRLERLNTWCRMRRFEPAVKAQWRQRVN